MKRIICLIMVCLFTLRPDRLQKEWAHDYGERRRDL